VNPALELSDEQAALRETFATFFAKESSPDVVRAAEPTGFDDALWARVRGLGIPGIAVEGASLADLTLIAQEAGRHLAPIPLVDSMVAVRLLDRLDHRPRSEMIEVFAPRPAIDGTTHLVPAGAIADAVVASDDEDLVWMPNGRRAPHLPNLGGGPIADCVLRGPERTIVATGDAARSAFERAVREWQLLTAAALAGLGRGVLELAIEYAKTRRQFGVPIGSFQALQHRLVDVATSVEGAELLVRRAAVDDERQDALAPMAAWFAAQTARWAAEVSLHVHGGYGFMLEQDVQLFFRRGTAWSLLLGDPAVLLDRVADALAARNWTLDDAAPVGFRAEVREFLAEHCPPEVVARVHETGTVHDWALHRALAAKGWLAADWPRDAGGQGRDAWEMLELDEELARVGAPGDGWGTTNVIGQSLLRVGTATQREQIVPAILRGDILCCLGYSEPDSGSDVAAARTRAVRDGDDWIINGQKMFTTLAHESTYVFLLTRTNVDAPKHRGLTMFLVPMATPGIEITPIYTLGGERTNVTYYADVRVPDSCRVGELDGGWDVMTIALAFERSPAMVGQLERLVRHFVAWASKQSDVLTEPRHRERLVRILIDIEVGRLLGYALAAAIARGELPYVEGSMAKLFASEALIVGASTLLDVLGEEGVKQWGSAGAPVDGWVEQVHRHAQVETIRGGTSEIQRSIIAERGLGLPRSPR
jgi:alkylation response protein AidB-like acyl-CoA dehydrogenase